MGRLRTAAATAVTALGLVVGLTSSAAASGASASGVSDEDEARLAGTILALEVDRGDTRVGRLITVRPNGTGRRVLTSGVTSGAYSPDGRRIAFGTLDGDIYVMPASGGPARRIVGGPYVSSDPTWSPDGRYVAYQSDGDIFRVTVAAPAGSVVRLTDDALDRAIACTFPARGIRFVDPAWHPRGNRIAVAPVCAYADDDLEPTGGYLAARGGTLNRTFAGIGFGNADWSPDGGRLAFRDNSGDAHLDLSPIYVMRTDGSGLRALTPLRNQDDGRGNADHPVWSPQGTFVAYARGRSDVSSGPTDLWITNAKGTNRWRVAADVIPLDWRR